jgi:hypothetical protein
MKYPRSFRDKKYPKFIRESIVFKAYPKPEKVFPRIGLKNCEVSLKSIKVNEDSLIIRQEIQTIQDYIVDIPKIEQDLYALRENLSELADADDEFTKIPTYTKQYFGLKEKYSELEVAKAVNKKLKKLKFDEEYFLSEKPSFISADKIFLTKNKNIKLCFSSDGPKGYWDIATMSMRGIRSCMQWKNDNSRTLIGSIADPYTGIIYMCDKTTNQMLARAVVRFVVNEKNGRPYLFLEKIYMNARFDKCVKIRDGEDRENVVLRLFKHFLVSKTRMDIASSEYDLMIPLSEITDSILDFGEEDSNNTLSYRDSELYYSYRPKYFDPKKIKISA